MAEEAKMALLLFSVGMIFENKLPFKPYIQLQKA